MAIDAKKILAVIAAVIAGLFLWSTPWVYPLKLLMVFMHECGHALAALAVGGSVDSITISPNEGGLCLSRIRPSFFNETVVSSAGYLGSALSGALLLYLSLRSRSGKRLLGGLALFLLVAGLLWARSLFTIGVVLGLAATIGLLARYLPDDASRGAGFFIAVFNSLYVLFDVRDDLWDSARRTQSDAAILASHTWIPSVVWAALWTVLSLALLGTALWLGSRGRRARTASARLAAR